MIIRFLLILSLSLVGCNISYGEEPKLKVGFIISLTGPLAEFGIAIQNGIQLAQEKSPDISKNIKIIYEDSEYKSKVAITNFKKLKDLDKVGLLYVFGGPMSDTLSPLAEKSKLPMFSTEYDTRYTRNKKYVVRFANNASDYANVVLEELRKRNLKKLIVVKMENQYHNTLSSAVIDGIDDSESAKILANFQPGESDFRAVLPTLKKGDYDALGVYVLPGGHNTFFAQVRNAGIKLKNIFGTDGFQSQALNKGVEDVVEGALFANSAVSKEFKERYLERFANVDQLVHAALAYEFILLVNDLFKGSKDKLSAKQIISKFALKSGRSSVFGEYFYRNTEKTGQYFSFPIALWSMRAGEPIVLKKHKAP